MKKKKVPRLKTAKQAEAFLTQDLSDLDFSQFKPAQFEFEKKDEQINMRVPRPLLGGAQSQGQGARHSLHALYPGNSRTGHGRDEVVTFLRSPAAFQTAGLRGARRRDGSGLAMTCRRR
jgi:hypothetical protein